MHSFFIVGLPTQRIKERSELGTHCCRFSWCGPLFLGAVRVFWCAYNSSENELADFVFERMTCADEWCAALAQVIRMSEDADRAYEECLRSIAAVRSARKKIAWDYPDQELQRQLLATPTVFMFRPEALNVLGATLNKQSANLVLDQSHTSPQQAFKFAELVHGTITLICRSTGDVPSSGSELDVHATTWLVDYAKFTACDGKSTDHCVFETVFLENGVGSFLHYPDYVQNTGTRRVPEYTIRTTAPVYAFRTPSSPDTQPVPTSTSDDGESQ